MTNKTRKEAIAWCIENKCDFIHPIYPPPNGWFWSQLGETLVLCPIFTITDQGDEITFDEVVLMKTKNHSI